MGKPLKNYKYIYEAHFNSDLDYSYYVLIGADSDLEAKEKAQKDCEKNHPGFKVNRIKNLGDYSKYIKLMGSISTIL
jgi:hypothetical protein